MTKSKKKQKEYPTILIDNREQQPFFFDKINDSNFPGLKIEFATITTGDYSIKGMSDPKKCEHSIAVERKSLPDLFGSMGRGRERLEKEFIRMKAFDYACVIIEADLKAIFTKPPVLSKMKPKSVLRTMFSWSQRYNVGFWPCPNREFAEKATYLILNRFWDDRLPGGKMYFNKI